MAHDAELDRLKAEQNRTFQRKQTAYQAQDQAWNRRSAARDTLARAHDEKQRAYNIQDAAWQAYQRLRANNGPRIDALNAQQEAAFQNMKSSFDRASSAHDARDGASARAYADQGHAYKAESQGYVAERRRLVQEIRDAKERHEATRPAFQCAKEQFDATKRTYDAAKADHERKQVDFKRTKADFDQAVAAFQSHSSELQAAAKRVARQGRLEGRWASKFRSDDGKIHIILDRDGNPTHTYPHVHVIHDELGSEVRVILSIGPSDHPKDKRETLPGTASGNEVNAAIERMLRELRMY